MFFPSFFDVIKLLYSNIPFFDVTTFLAAMLWLGARNKNFGFGSI